MLFDILFLLHTLLLERTLPTLSGSKEQPRIGMLFLSHCVASAFSIQGYRFRLMFYCW